MLPHYPLLLQPPVDHPPPLALPWYVTMLPSTIVTLVAVPSTMSAMMVCCIPTPALLELPGTMILLPVIGGRWLTVVLSSNLE